MKSLARFSYFSSFLAVVLGTIAIGYYAGQYGHDRGTHIVPPAHAEDRLDRLDGRVSEKKLWVCPMHPQILQDHPGSCPICGMDLVEAGGAHAHDAGVQVDSASLQRLGVRLASAEHQVLSREVQTYGNVTLDETSVFNVSPKIEGWVRKLHVTAVGQPVHAGQVLYEIHSPELVQRQREYIELLQRRDRMLESMAQATNMADLSSTNAQMAASLARERVRMLEKFAYADVGEKTLADIEKLRRPVNVVPVFAPKSGFVTEIGAREGAYVTPMVNLLSLADTAKVWIDIVLYPDQLAWVREGDEVRVKLPHSDESEIAGHLKFASPVVDTATRTVRARLAVDNRRGQFRPGSFVDVVIATQPHEALAVPRSAVMRTGKGNTVMLARGNGHFFPLPVETGVESGDLIEITEGLQEGARVAVNGQFLLDAAAALSDAAQRMQDGH